MKLIADVLYLTEAETGISPNTLKSARLRGTEGYVFLKDAALGWLLQWDALPAALQLPVLQRLQTTDLYEWYRNNGFKAYLKPDSEAYLFFTRYTYDGGTKCLKKPYIDQYLLCAQVLNALAANRHLITEALQYIKANNLKLPFEKIPLQRKLNKYINGGGYACIISGKFGNKCAEKPKDMAVLRQLAGRPQNYDNALVAFDYNRYALQSGLPTLSPSRVYQIATSAQVRAQIDGQRHGMHQWRNQSDIIVSRKRPSHPLAMTVHDGFDWELYYQKQVKDSKGHKVTRHHFRKNVVVVVDAFNDYPLGFAIGDSECAATIQTALKSAAMHIYELTGGYYLQHEIKCDNFAKGMHEFYAKVATHVSPSKVGNARDKVVESWFKRFNDKYTIRHHNYSGKNVTSLKTNQPNRDYLDKYKGTFPDETGVMLQIVQDIETQRAEKREEWLQGWHNTPAERKRSISRAEYLELFATGSTERELTTLGLQIQVQGNKYLYMLLEQDFVQSIGVKLQVMYDHADMSSVLAIDEVNRRKWLVAMKEMMPMARIDMAEGDRTKLNQYLALKEEREQAMINANQADWNEINSRSDAEAIIKGFFTYSGGNKGIQAEAKRALVMANDNKEGGIEEQIEQTYVKAGSMKVLD